jgi:hypothetical protein
MIELLHNLGVNCGNPCDALNEIPLTHALRMDDKNLAAFITMLIERDIKSATLFYKNFLRQKAVKKYRCLREKVIFLQKLFRKGFFVRRVKEIEGDDGEDEVPIASQFSPPSTAQCADFSKLDSELMFKNGSEQGDDGEDVSSEVRSGDNNSGAGKNGDGESGEKGNEDEEDS